MTDHPIDQLVEKLRQAVEKPGDPQQREQLYREGRAIFLRLPPEQESHRILQKRLTVYEQKFGQPSGDADAVTTLGAAPAQDGDPGRRPDPFQAVLAEAAKLEQARFTELSHLMTGAFSSGYKAVDTLTHEHVVLKFPSRDSWLSQPEEHERALRAEHAILSRVNSLLRPDPDGCALAVRALSIHTLSVRPDGFPAPLGIPCVIQSFARGTRLFDPGALPMRGPREADGVRLMVQLTGMLIQLYQHGICHGDLKPDCLFWDSQSQMLEVIDWNTAREGIGQHEKQAEFATLQALTAEMFIGPTRQERDIAFHLFGAFDGEPLSRGVRLLLLRLLEPAVTNPITTLDELHGALVELLNLWRNPLGQRPEMPTAGGNRWERLSKLLSAVEVECQRDPADTAALSLRHEWNRAARQDVGREARSALSAWIEHPDRPGIVRLTDLWSWLPDVWPLMWLVPLAQTWRESAAIAPDRDPQLVQLASALVQRRWDELDRQLGYAEAGAPAEIAQQLKYLRMLLGAHRDLEEAQRIAAATLPDYPRAFQRIVPVEPLLRADDQAVAVIEPIANGARDTTAIRRLHERLATVASWAPSEARHIERWRAVAELRQDYSITHADFQRCQHLERERATVRSALGELRALVAAEAWPAAEAHAAAIQLSPEFSAELPDLAAQLEDLAGRARQWRQVDRQYADERTLTAAAQRAHTGDVLGALQLVAAAREGGQGGQRFQQFAAALQAIHRRDIAMADGDIAAAQAIDVPDVVQLRDLVHAQNRLIAIAAQGAAIPANAPLTDYAAYLQSLKQFLAVPPVPALTEAIARRLYAATRVRLDEQLRSAVGRLQTDQAKSYLNTILGIENPTLRLLNEIQDRDQRAAEQKTAQMIEQLGRQVQADLGDITGQAQGAARDLRQEMGQLTQQVTAGFQAREREQADLSGAVSRIEQQIQSLAAELRPLSPPPPAGEESVPAGPAARPHTRRNQRAPFLLLAGSIGLVALLLAVGFQYFRLNRDRPTSAAPGLTPTWEQQRTPSAQTSGLAAAAAAPTTSPEATLAPTPAATSPLLILAPAEISGPTTLTLTMPGTPRSTDTNTATAMLDFGNGVPKTFDLPLGQSDSAALFLDERLFSDVASFTLPQFITVSVSGATSATLRISGWTVKVKGVSTAVGQGSPLTNDGNIAVAQERGNETDLSNRISVTTGVLTLSDDDTVMLLQAEEDWYRIRVIETKLDSGDTKGKGIEGWVPRGVIDGPTQ